MPRSRWPGSRRTPPDHPQDHVCHVVDEIGGIRTTGARGLHALNEDLGDPADEDEAREPAGGVLDATRTLERGEGLVDRLAEAQSAWIAEMLTGGCAPPSAAEVRAQMTRDHERYKRRFYASPRHTMEVDFDHFLWDLARERRAGARRAAAQRRAADRMPHRVTA